MGKGYLIDSNAIIVFFKKTLPENGRSLLSGIAPLISVITFIEIFANAKVSDEEVEELQNFCNIATVYQVI